MNELVDFSYEDYLHNLTKNCEKMENFNSTSLNSLEHLDDNCCLNDQTSTFNKFIIEEETSIENLNLSSSLSNTLSNTISSASSSSNLNDYSINQSSINFKQQNEQNLNLTKQLQKAKLTNNLITTNNFDFNKTKIPIKKRKAGVNHKFVNNPKHLKKNNKDFHLNQSPFQLKLLKTNDHLTFNKNESDKLLKTSNDTFKNYTQTTAISNVSSSKGMGCGKPGYITCSICNATKYYSHVQRRFGQFSCEPCSKFMKKFLKDPKVYYCVANGECQIGKPSGEQEPRGVSVNRCKACWLKICLNKFVLDDNTKNVIDSHYTPRLQKNSINLNDNRSNDDNLIQLPPLPLLNTRKRKNNDDILIEKFSHQQELNNKNLININSKLKTDIIKSKRKNKDDTLKVTKLDKRERKRRLIYSPPSTPKRNNKKRLKDDDEFDLNDKLIDKNRKLFDDNQLINNETNNSSLDSNDNQFIQNNLIINNSIQINCEDDCGQCSICLNEDQNLNSTFILSSTETKNYTSKLNDNDLSYTQTSEDCLIDNCSEFNYNTLTNKDDYLKDNYYDIPHSFSSTTKTQSDDDELGLKFFKNYEKSTIKKKESTKFKNIVKKNKKRKDISTSNNLMKKSLIKKNSFSYILDADSTVLYEVLNANSPFL